jgi:hypothetical protein
MIIKTIFSNMWNFLQRVCGCSVKVGLRTLVLTLRTVLDIFKPSLIRMGRDYSGNDRTV